MTNKKPISKIKQIERCIKENLSQLSLDELSYINKKIYDIIKQKIVIDEEEDLLWHNDTINHIAPDISKLGINELKSYQEKLIKKQEALNELCEDINKEINSRNK